MGIYEELRTEMAERATRALAPRFSPAGPSIDPGTLYGVQSIDQAVPSGRWRVSRREAMSIPAIKRGHDIICRVGQQPLQMLDAANQVHYRAMLDQPETGIAPVITWSRIVADLVFERHAWLAVTAVGFDGRPAAFARLDPETVAVPQHTRVFRTATGSGTAQVFEPDPYLIRIDSPTEPLLEVGARAVRALGRLELAALRAAEGVPPQDWFTLKDPTSADPDQDTIDELLEAWLTARNDRATAYVPAALDYKQSTVDAEKAQLADARQHGVLEVARLLGIDPEDLGVSTTSRTYANAQDRKRERVDFTLGQYMSAIESRLSMNDITPAGYVVRFDTSSLTTADDYTAAQTDEINARTGVEVLDEIRTRRGRVALDAPVPQSDHQES